MAEPATAEQPRPFGSWSRRTLLFAAVATFLLTLFEMDVLEWTLERVGIPHRWYFTVLAASFFGSLVNLPLGTTPPRPDGGRTLIALNVGGGLVPVLLSLHLLVTQPQFGLPVLLALAIVSAATHAVARPVPGVGIAMPILLAPIVAASAAFLLAPQAPAAVAYIAGAVGTLIGADLLNLRRLDTLAAPVVSIGGAGTFDGIFVSGMLAALLA